MESFSFLPFHQKIFEAVADKEMTWRLLLLLLFKSIYVHTHIYIYIYESDKHAWAYISYISARVVTIFEYCPQKLLL